MEGLSFPWPTFPLFTLPPSLLRFLFSFCNNPSGGVGFAVSKMLPILRLLPPNLRARNVFDKTVMYGGKSYPRPTASSLFLRWQPGPPARPPKPSAHFCQKLGIGVVPYVAPQTTARRILCSSDDQLSVSYFRYYGLPRFPLVLLLQHGGAACS